MAPPPAARPALLLAVAVAVAAPFLALSPTGAAADPPPPAPPIDLSADMAPIDVVEITEGPVPPALAGEGATATSAATAAASVEPIQPGPAFGFAVFSTGVPNFGAYRFQLVDGTPEVVRSWMQAVADQLTSLTSIQFSVDPGTVPRWAGYGSDLFPTSPSDATTWGVIRVISFDSLSPCGTLNSSVVGCGGPDDIFFRGAQTHVRGSIWLSPSLLTAPAALQGETAAHEAGHALGLHHYPPQGSGFNTTFEGVTQLMNASVSATPPPGRCGTRYRSGDRNGVWYHHNRFAWITTAQYRDFLGRIPDRGGYEFWLRSGVDAGQLAASLAGSAEWVGRVVDDLYIRFRGAPPESAAAREFWSAQVRALGPAKVAAELFASQEYFARNGGNVDDWIRALYRDLLGAGRTPDAAGLAFWRNATAQTGRVGVAFSIYQSLENRQYRVDRLYLDLLNRAADSAGRAFWSEQVLHVGDLALATFLASSAEYQSNADEFALAPPACTT